MAQIGKRMPARLSLKDHDHFAPAFGPLFFYFTLSYSLARWSTDSNLTRCISAFVSSSSRQPLVVPRETAVTCKVIKCRSKFPFNNNLVMRANLLHHRGTRLSFSKILLGFGHASQSEHRSCSTIQFHLIFKIIPHAELNKSIILFIRKFNVSLVLKLCRNVSENVCTVFVLSTGWKEYKNLRIKFLLLK